MQGWKKNFVSARDSSASSKVVRIGGFIERFDKLIDRLIDVFSKNKNFSTSLGYEIFWDFEVCLGVSSVMYPFGCHASANP